MAHIPSTTAKPWLWIASDLLEALRLAQAEIRDPAAAQRAGKDIHAIINRAICATTEDDHATREDSKRWVGSAL
jgi:hypothetical protein